MSQTKNENPSSIGQLDQPYYDKDNDRVKAFFTKSVSEKEEIEKIIRSLREMQKETNSSRITARMIVNNGLITQKNYEASIPLSNSLSNYHLVYFGENTRKRKSRKKTIQEELRFVQKIKNNELERFKKLDQKLSDQGYSVELLDNPSEQNLKDIVELYAASYASYTYELTPENIRKLVNNNNNYVAVVKDKNKKIVSIGVAETENFLLELDRGRKQLFKFAELSDAATHPEHRSQGLYTSTSIKLHKMLTQNDFDLVYGEARSCNFGVNKACQNIGRQYCGTLEKHCVISGHKDIQEIGKYENLNVWALNHNQLNNLFGKR